MFSQEIDFSVCENCWDPDSLGNHRAVVEVTKKSDVAKVTIPWRRRDLKPEDKNILVYSEHGKQIVNVSRGSINRELGEVFFEPSEGIGKYYIYYLKQSTVGRSNYPTVNYPPFKSAATPNWLGKLKSARTAEAISIQAIDELNSFFPMEVIATEAEVNKLKGSYAGNFILFPEDRMHPIVMRHDLPYRWVKQSAQNKFEGKAARGENFSYQLGLYASKQDVNNVKVEFSDLKSADGNVIASTTMSSLNTTGVDWDGKSLNKIVNVKKGDVQALWCLIDVPSATKPGTYKGTVKVSAEGNSPVSIDIVLNIENEVVSDGGVSEPWKQTRLTWLNSQLGANNEVIAPYSPLVVKDRIISFLGREVALNAYGLPAQITSYFDPKMTSLTTKGKPMLKSDFMFRINANGTDAITWKNNGLRITKQTPGLVQWETTNESAELIMKIKGQIEFDGFMSYSIELNAKTDLSLGETRLEIPMQQLSTPYFMGLGERGGKRDSYINWKWDVASKNQDGGWIGDVNGGIHFSLRDENYVRPLNTNFYLQKPLVLPTSWGNEGKGGITIEDSGDVTLVRAYSGSREMKKGDQLFYNINLLITPFHTIDTDFQWKTRFYHQFSPVDTVVKKKASVVNVHHANDINPYINYPFIQWKEMKEYIDEAHSKGLKVKIYNTIRELSNRAYETQPMRSLGTEIYSPGTGGGFSWLQEHIAEDYIAAWFVPHLKDAAIINSGMSRWHNYYVEGMSWLVKNVGIDGIYLDDVAFDRTTMKRIRRVMGSERGPGIIDFHSANQFNERDGYNNSGNLYMEHFPYINRLWFGEYFDYDMDPDFWLVEVSGIPFGLMGEMLEKGGNKWRGMVYGMTNRLPWGGNDPSQVWEFWDEFGIEDTEMIGYWVKDNPIRTNNEKVKATLYRKQDNALLIAVASWAESDVSVELDIDWGALGIKPRSLMQTPAIPDYQEEQTLRVKDSLTIPKEKGFLIVIK
ncbi:MAG: glycoside hydrolase domain-containing protein [Cyclobacteriaceae bacterium]